MNVLCSILMSTTSSDEIIVFLLACFGGWIIVCAVLWALVGISGKSGGGQ